ncbi:hypothetical protein ABZT06_45975 [Streptomyces sp. NPDC005483]|uniref:hypothetical protein n=1 Tax=Streptomyces sp. NPDC005483 TaxID=3154882 RepID=UPI0033BC8B0F
MGALHLRVTAKAAQLRRALTPGYTLGCKRLLLANTYCPAVTRPNFDVHVTVVTAVHAGHVIGADGSSADVDTIILGTGFHLLDMPVAQRMFDAVGASLDDRWKGSPDAYLGPWHSSAYMVLEAQLDYVASTVRHFARRTAPDRRSRTPSHRPDDHCRPPRQPRRGTAGPHPRR